MASTMLTLPDECLQNIISFIDDPRSFQSVILTCKRFYRATENARSILHRKLMRVKAEYLIKCWIVESKYCCRNLIELLGECARLTARKRLLTYDKVLDVWKRNGPVVAKLFTWTRSNDIFMHAGSNVKRVIMLHLPSYVRNMVIETTITPDSFYEEVVDLRSALHIHVTCGDLEVHSFPDIEEVKDVMEPMKAVVELLQKELGETVPPITSHFFIWLCFFFPDRSNLLGDNRLSFKEAATNTKPNLNLVQTAIVEFHNELQFENSLQKLLTTWINTEQEREQTQDPEMIAWIIHLLSQRSETKILGRLEEDASRFYDIVIHPDTRQLPRDAMLDLLLRTSLGASTYKDDARARKYAESRVSFRCAGGRVMKIRGAVQGDGRRWGKLELKFTLPDDKVLRLTPDYNVLRLESPLDLRMLDPVTELLQEGFDQNWPETRKIGKMTNFLTAVYFINALEFDDAYSIAFDSFDRMLPLTRFPESEEESDYWDSSPELYWLEN